MKLTSVVDKPVRVGLVIPRGPGRRAIEHMLGRDGRLIVVRMRESVPLSGLPSGADVWLCQRCNAPGFTRNEEGLPVLGFCYGTDMCTDAEVVLPLESGRLESTFELLKNRLIQLGSAGQRAKSVIRRRPVSLYPTNRGMGGERLVIAIGASTGGPSMLQQVLAGLPADSPPVLVVQHIRPSHIAPLVRQLDRATAMHVQLAENGAKLSPGNIYVAPPKQHLSVGRNNEGDYKIVLNEGLQVCGHRPSVDVLLKSVAAEVGAQGIGVVMTGMGVDGAEGLLALRRSGGITMAQDAETSTVYGMCKAAYECGGAQKQVALDNLAPEILAACRRLLRAA